MKASSHLPTLITSFALSVLFGGLTSCQDNSENNTIEQNSPPAHVPAEQLKCKVLEEMTRPYRGFTQGLFIDAGKLYESTGGYGTSLVRRIDLKSQKIEVSKDLPNQYFGEGLAPFGDNKMIQLTWKSGQALVLDRENINVEKVFRYQTEGWGIATQKERMVMSDGSSKLTFMDPENFHPLKKISITKNGKPVELLNELEWVGDHIYANVWMTDEIVKIDSETGKVVASIDCRGLLKKTLSSDAVLNGIAYDHSTQTFYITGKLWPKIFKVEFIKA